MFVVIFHALCTGCKRAVGFFLNAVFFFRQAAGSGAVFHLVVSARGILRSYRMLKMPVVPCYPVNVRHTRELASFLFLVLDEGVDLVDVAFSRFISVGPAVFCAFVSVCLFVSVATWLCSLRVSAFCGCWAVGVVTVSWHLFCTCDWSRLCCVFCALYNPTDGCHGVMSAVTWVFSVLRDGLMRHVDGSFVTWGFCSS